MNERELDKELRVFCGEHLRLSSVLEFLMGNEEVNALLVKSNDNMIGRMSYTDHGRVHAKVVALNSLKLFSIISKLVKPTIIAEKDGKIEDSLIAVLISAWLHDVGLGVNRDNHELLGLIKAGPIIKRLLEGIYDAEDRVKLSSFIEEGILCHLGTYHSTSIEAGIVCVADGTDITCGRARFSYMKSDRDIHDFSAMSIQKVKIKSGPKCVEVHVFMDSPAGVFQVEETLLKKIKSTKIKHLVKVIVHIKGEKDLIKY